MNTNHKRRPRAVQVELGTDIVDAVYMYKETLDLPTVGVAIEMLCRQALAATPEAGVVRGAHINARTECRRWVFDRVQSLFLEMQAEMKG